ncbi:MAG TPA: hydroxymethylglutaryl-CoA reductase [Terriglobales bacterium]|nr:hydroxymethylglutaryl-CoA reductase [Terriglobales bacterium]
MVSSPEIRSRLRIPRAEGDDYSHEMAAARREFIRQETGVELTHVASYSIDPATLPGNIENFIGVAQVPIGVAGPLRIEGEYARGDFYIPLATTEGALVASYNRGMGLLSECGGVKTTVVDEAMQRSPVFVFDDARQAREFGQWVERNSAAIQRAAEATTEYGKLRNITQFAVGPLRYLRFNYTTGDAAGQNMVSKATSAACEWMERSYNGKLRYFLSGNIDTDKKHSHLNTLLTRGKRVVAEAVIKREALQQILRIDSRDLFWARQVQMAGAFLAGSSSNGAHAANGLAALFIATGQDAANIAESHAAITYSQYLENGDYYWSITVPSLIVGTCGGGTGLPTQRQCMEMLGCYGPGKAKKLAEICAAVVLAGETSLAAAMIHGDWVAAHERLGRNRPAR